jgi:hypothetical protein
MVVGRFMLSESTSREAISSHRDEIRVISEGPRFERQITDCTTDLHNTVSCSIFSAGAGMADITAWIM